MTPHDSIAELVDFDECKCGDYRKDHAGGVGACIHNKPRDLTHGYVDCMEFRLSRKATEIPPAYRALRSPGERQ
jgi:hypothetical protein